MTLIVRESKRSRMRRTTGRFDMLAIEALKRDLESALPGRGDFSDAARALFSTDASNYRQAPLGVVTPRTADEVVRAVEVCRDHYAPITPRGGGTALAGQTCNEAIIIDFSRWMTKVLEIDAKAKRARVEPGCILDELRFLAERYGLTFGPDPATHTHNTLGGMIGNDSCGVHSIQAGRTAHNVERLDVLTYDGLRLDVGATSDHELRSIITSGGRRGQIYRDMQALMRDCGELIRERFPDIPRRVSGFANLDALLPENGFNVARALVGTEANCVIVLGATLKLVKSPRCRSLAIVRFKDIFEAADAVPDVRDYEPLAIEGLDRGLIDRIHKKDMALAALDEFEQGGGWLLVEFGGQTEEEVRRSADRLTQRYGDDVRVVTDEQRQAAIWKIREQGLGATAFVPGEADAFPGWEDSAVAPERFGVYLRDLRALMGRHGYDAALYGHFGDGLVHCRVDFDLRTRKGVHEWRAFLNEAADLVVAHGGSLSGEHGDGQARAALLPKMYGADLLNCFARFKTIWDPDARLNPGKVVFPNRIEANLRLGPGCKPADAETQFAFDADDGSFERATERCVGVGKCRRKQTDDEVMCPSYLVTGEERHSTRGRAHLLFEMLRGDTLKGGWGDSAVEEALSLCLACKGCLSDCPVNVDMATYKAEFRYHHYKHKLRPRAAYSLGMIHRWAPLMAGAPWLVNRSLRAPGLSQGGRWIAGVAADASLPQFARRSFRSLPRRKNRRGDRVVLWPDTFNNFFHTPALESADRVLRSQGYNVVLPRSRLCCGRALYDWGFLRTARRLWRKTIAVLANDIKRGTPIVVIEPACLSAFRHELPGLLPNDPRAKRLSELAVSFAEFAGRRDLSIRDAGSVLLQPHCHAHAMNETDHEAALLSACGAQVRRVDEGCCGMAGSFGLAADTRAVAMAIGERGVLPKVRAAAEDTQIIACGFSCRAQIKQGALRPAKHIAEFIAARLPD